MLKKRIQKNKLNYKTELQKQLESPTDDGDKLYIIVDEINNEAIKFRMVLCKMEY